MGDVEFRTSVDDAAFRRAIDALVHDLDAPAGDDIAAAGERIAAAESPVLTGELRAGNRGVARRGATGDTVASVENPVRHAGPVDSGTPTTPANPFMDRTAQQLEPLAVRLLENDINHTIRTRGLS